MLSLYDYQKEGVDFLAGRDHAMLADQPGLGKTAQALVAAKKIGAKKVLALGPKSSVLNWYREVNLWYPGCNFYATNYDRISAGDQVTKDLILGKQWDVIILDEAHRLKGPTAKRTRFVYRELPKRAKHVWLLTGTPAPNHAGEMWTHLRALRPDLILGPDNKPMSLQQFEDRYCVVEETVYGRTIKGTKNADELRAKVMGDFLLRRLTKNVLPDMPAVRYAYMPLNPKNLPREMARKVEELTGTRDLPDDEIIKMLRDEEVALATERRLTGLLKVPLAGDWIDDELEAPGKMLVFAHHTEVIDKLMDRLKEHKPVKIDGRDNSARRAENILRFQVDPECRVFVGQIQACGEAITLTAANRVVFVEAEWTPSDNYQAVCRAHRIGQKDGVIAYYLSLSGSLDETIQRVLTRKARELSELFGD